VNNLKTLGWVIFLAVIAALTIAYYL